MAHPGGRPPFYDDPGKLILTSFENKSFDSEKKMIEFIDANIELFCSDLLEIEYSGHEKEYIISQDNRKGRVDYRFKSPVGDIYVECKNTTHAFSEAHKALGQLLAYSCLADQYNRKLHRLILVTSSYDKIIGDVIKRFNLPIEVFVLTKSQIMKLL